jgi:hypothetical protein
MSPLLPGAVLRSSRLALLAVAGSILAIVPLARGVVGVPLPNREGVVVAWQPASSIAVVVTDDHRAYAIHTLRKVTPGVRVRVDGIKWGAPTSGIKWSVAPSGIKWGIKWGIKRANNGSYSSRLTPLAGVARTTSLRGTVVRRFGRRGVAVSIPGSTVVIPLRGAVWLPGGKRTHATGDLGKLGSKVTITIGFDAGRTPVGRRVVQTAPASATPTVPLAGRVSAVDPVTRTVTLQVGTKAFPVAFTLSVPASTDLSKYPSGAVVTALAVATAPDGPLVAVDLVLNGTFAQADTPPPVVPVGPAAPANPAGPTSPTAPSPASPQAIAAIEQMRVRWADGRAQGLIPNTGLFTSQHNHLGDIAGLIAAADRAGATAQLLEFETRLATTPAGTISISFRDEMSIASVELRRLLA